MKTLYILRDHVVQITLAADLVRTAYPGATAVEVSDDYVTSVGATYVLPVTARPATEQDRLNWSTRTLPNKEALHLLNSQLARGVRLLECPATAIVDGITYELNSASPRQFVAVGTDPRGYGIKPKFLVQPQRQTVPAGAKVQFSVVVLAAASLQWRKNGANISGATGVTLEVASAAEADSGAAYDCVATNPVGSTTSDPAILTVGAASGNGTTPPAPSTSLMTFARLSSNGQQATNTDNYTHFNDRHSVVNRAGVPVNQIVLRFSNTAANGASLNNGSQPVTISVGIGPESSVQATGALTRALFPGGGNTYTLAPGEVVDTLPVTLAADIAHNAAMCVMVHSAYTTAPALLNASCTPGSRSTVDVNEGGIGIASKASGGSITGRYLNRHINGPIAVFATPVGTPTLKSVAVFGDSIAAGANDSTTGGGLTGFIQRSLATTAVGVAYSTTAQSGYSWNAAFSGSPSDDFIRKAQIIKDGAYTHALMCLGGNDVKDGVTAASIQTRMLAAKAWFLARGIKMIPMTGLPRTNSTNTGANSSDAAGAMTEYLQMNDNIRNNVGGVSEFGYFDRHVALADPGDPTRWRTDLGGNVYDADGIHLTTLGHTTLTNALSAAAPTLFI